MDVQRKIAFFFILDDLKIKKRGILFSEKVFVLLKRGTYAIVYDFNVVDKYRAKY